MICFFFFSFQKSLSFGINLLYRPCNPRITITTHKYYCCFGCSILHYSPLLYHHQVTLPPSPYCHHCQWPLCHHHCGPENLNNHLLFHDHDFCVVHMHCLCYITSDEENESTTRISDISPINACSKGLCMCHFGVKSTLQVTFNG